MVATLKLMPIHILRLKTVLARTGLSRATLYRKIQAGTFPAQFRISQRCVGWQESAIDQWIESVALQNGDQP